MYVYRRSSATISNPEDSHNTDSNIPVFGETNLNNPGTTQNLNIDYTHLDADIIRLQNSGSSNTIGGASLSPI